MSTKDRAWWGRNPERWVALGYLVAGAAWVLVSDLLGWEGERPRGNLGDLAFVLLTAVALHAGVRALLGRLQASRDEAAQGEARYRQLFERSPDGIIIRQGPTVVLANPAAERLTGVGPGGLVGRPVTDFVVPEEQAEVEARAARAAGGEPIVPLVRRRIRREDGSVVLCETETTSAEHLGAPATRVVVRDVSDLVRVEAERERLDRTLRLLVAAGEALLHAVTEDDLAQGTCDAAVREGGLLAAFVGLAGRTAGSSLRLVGHAGADAAFAASVAARMADPGEPGSVASRAMGSARPLAIQDLRQEPPGPAVRSALDRGGRSALSLPLPGPQGRLGMVVLVSTEPGFFDPAVTARLTSLAASLAFALQALRSRAVLRGFLDHAPMSMFVYDPEGRVLELNAHWERLNQRSADGLRGRLAEEVFPAGLVEDLVATNREVLEARAPLRYERRLPTTSGEIDVDISKFPILAGEEVLGVAGVAVDVTAWREAERALRASHEAYRALSARLISAREDEQARISRDLHDDLGQLLTGLQLELAALGQRLEAEPASARNGALLDRVVAAQVLGAETAEAVRRVASGLRPGLLDQLGLGAALAQAGRQFEAQIGVPCRVEVADPWPAVEPAVATAAWRIAQEALTNVARHAGAHSVRVVASAADGWLVLTVVDDGVGLKAEASSGAGLGLLGMRERADAAGGEVVVRAAQGGGTEVVARLPLRARAREPA